MKVLLTPLYYVKALALTCWMLTTVNTLAQVQQTHRYEREHKNSDEYYSVISLQEEGIALLREKDKYEGNKKMWELLVLDTALQEKNTIEFHIEERYPLIGYEVAPQRLFLLYRTGDTNKNSMVLVELNTFEGKEVSRHDIKPEVDFKLTHFTKTGNSIILGGYISNDPTILIYDFNAKSIKVVPGFFQKDNELVELRVNQNNTFNIVLIDRSMRHERKLVFRTFDETGKLLLEDVVPIEEERALQTSLTSRLVREDLMVIGTWGDRQGKQSGGFFALPVDPFKEQKIRYYYFGELNHFVDYLNPKRAERIKENAKDDVQAGRRPSFTSYVIPFRIEESKNGYVLLAEVYNPISTSNPYYSTPYGNPYYYNPYAFYNPFWPSYYPGMRYRPYSYGNNVKNADQIRTYATVLVAFDAAGNLLWDQSMKLDDIEKPALEQVSDFYNSGDNIIFLYKKESELKSKRISLLSDAPEESSEKIKLKEESDELRDEKESEGGLKYWIENSFYVYGYQTIRNVNKKDDRVRDVFYITKVVAK
jgi:small nuclear ribonucleoprotein (snRNP)-like protein